MQESYIWGSIDVKECEYDEAGNVKKVTSYRRNEKGEKESLRYTSYYEESLPKVISDVGQKYEAVIEEMGGDNPESASYRVRSYTAKRVEWTSEEWYKKQVD